MDAINMDFGDRKSDQSFKHMFCHPCSQGLHGFKLNPCALHCSWCISISGFKLCKEAAPITGHYLEIAHTLEKMWGLKKLCLVQMFQHVEILLHGSRIRLKVIVETV